MFQKLVTLVGSFVVLCSGVFAQPVTFPADTPYYYNPESGFTLVDFNGGGLFDFDCGVDYNGANTGYTMRLPVSMDRVFEIPYRLDEQGIDTICDGTFEGGIGSYIYMNVPINMTGQSQSVFHDYMFQHDGPAVIVGNEVYGLTSVLVAAMQIPEPITGFESDILNTEPSCITYPEESSSSAFILESCDTSWSCYSLSTQFVSFLDVCSALESPPSSWNPNAAHAASEFTYHPNTPSEFIVIFERYEDRMMAIYHNFWVQNNDPNTLFFVAEQNRLQFTRLAYDLLIDELISEYAVWLAVQP